MTGFGGSVGDYYVGQTIWLCRPSRWGRAWQWFRRVILRRRSGLMVVMHVDYANGIITYDVER